MIYLSDRSGGRDNNLNLIRAIAATMVLVSHAYPIALGPDAIQPLKLLTGQSLGSLSVYVFFAISGFLITMSFERSSSYRSFLTARFLRLLPGLVVSLALVAFVMGPLVTELPLMAYLTHPETWTFMLRNILLALPQYTLPGTFEDLPYPSVEGSIWTLIYEVICYMGVFACGVVGILQRRWLMVAGCAMLVCIWLVIQNDPGIVNERLVSLSSLMLPFMIGMCFYLWRDRVALSIWILAGLVVLCWAFHGTLVFQLLLVITLCYGTFWLGYVPGGILRRYNDLGDYSYGIYVYAFPIQGLVVWLFGPQDPLFNMAVSLPPTVLCGVLSWYLIEEPALGKKAQVLEWLGVPSRQG